MGISVNLESGSGAEWSFWKVYTTVVAEAAAVGDEKNRELRVREDFIFTVVWRKEGERVKEVREWE